MRLELISAFVSVADHLSFSTASKMLNVTPSSLSRQVRELESSIGIQLLARISRRIALTVLGSSFMVNAAQAYQKLIVLYKWLLSWAIYYKAYYVPLHQ